MSSSTIVVASQHEAVRWLLTELLVDAGYTLILEEYPPSVPAMVAHKPQLIIVETGTHGAAQGWSLVAQLAHDPAACAIPLLVCSVDRFSVGGDTTAYLPFYGTALVLPATRDTILATVRALLTRQPVPWVEQTVFNGNELRERTYGS